MSEHERETMHRLLGATPQCPSLNELLDGADSGDQLRAHRAACPHCRAELALFAAFDRPPSAAETTAVEHIGTRLAAIDWERAREHGLPEKREAWWRRWLRPAILAPASLAVVCSLLLITVVQVNRRAGPRPEIREPESEAIRSNRVEAVFPLGAVERPPARLQWREVPGAVAYKVQVMEVDRTVLWQGYAEHSPVNLPSEVVSRIVPAKRILWEVAALNGARAEVAASGTQSFTVNLH